MLSRRICLSRKFFFHNTRKEKEDGVRMKRKASNAMNDACHARCCVLWRKKRADIEGAGDYNGWPHFRAIFLKHEL